MQRGLQVIASRTESLSRFTPPTRGWRGCRAPQLAPVVLKPLLQRVAGLETRVPVTSRPGPDVTVDADADQLEQLLINLVRNAADATLEAGGARVTVGWRRTRARRSRSAVDDEGPGLSNTANLFVPFFTTKPGGSGIGLVLCRQIAEAHGGSLTLEPRAGPPGARATLDAARSDRRPPREAARPARTVSRSYAESPGRRRRAAGGPYRQPRPARSGAAPRMTSTPSPSRSRSAAKRSRAAAARCRAIRSAWRHRCGPGPPRRRPDRRQRDQDVFGGEHADPGAAPRRARGRHRPGAPPPAAGSPTYRVSPAAARSARSNWPGADLRGRGRPRRRRTRPVAPARTRGSRRRHAAGAADERRRDRAVEMVDSTPMAVGPPSSTRSTTPSRSASTCAAVSDSAARSGWRSGPPPARPRRASKPRATGCAGTRTRHRRLPCGHRAGHLSHASAARASAVRARTRAASTRASAGRRARACVSAVGSAMCTISGSVADGPWRRRVGHGCASRACAPRP